MFKRIVGFLGLLVVVFLVYPTLVESQCTTRDCEGDNEADLSSVCLRNQEAIARLQQEVTVLKEELAEKEESTYALFHTL